MRISDWSSDVCSSDLMEVVRASFRPEFLNRLDEVILFRRLSRENMTGIVEIQLMRLRKLLEDRKIELRLDDAAKHWLGDDGYDLVYGARSLMRSIHRQFQNPLASLFPEREIPHAATVQVRPGPQGPTLKARATP